MSGLGVSFVHRGATHPKEQQMRVFLVQPVNIQSIRDHHRVLSVKRDTVVRHLSRVKRRVRRVRRVVQVHIQ